MLPHTPQTSPSWELVVSQIASTPDRKLEWKYNTRRRQGGSESFQKVSENGKCVTKHEKPTGITHNHRVLTEATNCHWFYNWNRISSEPLYAISSQMIFKWKTASLSAKKISTAGIIDDWREEVLLFWRATDDPDHFNFCPVPMLATVTVMEALHNTDVSFAIRG